MPRLPLHPSSGTGIVQSLPKSIRLVRYGCSNRPFYHIVVMHTCYQQRKPPIEQLGTYDPLPNRFNEKLVALNLERIQYWLGQRVHLSKPVAEVLGLSGFLPIHPRTYMTAWRNRRAAKQADVDSASQAESVA